MIKETDKFHFCFWILILTRYGLGQATLRICSQLNYQWKQIDKYQMKYNIAIVIALILIITVNTANNLANESESKQIQSKGFSLFSSLFGNVKNQNRQADKTLDARAIFKGLQSLKQLRQNSGNSFLKSQSKQKQLDDQIPYEALLPRRRIPLNLNMQNAEKLFEEEANKPNNPIHELISEISKQRKEGNDVSWENPVFRNDQSGQQKSFFNIFGKRRQRKNQNRFIITQSEIEEQLQKIPSFEGGKLLKMTMNNYKKGLFLNIDYLDKQNKMFNIIARYRPRKHKLQIISVKSNSVLNKVQLKQPLESTKNPNPFQNENNQSGNKQQDVKALEEKLKAMQELNKVLQSKIVDKEKVENKKEQTLTKPTENTLPAEKKQQNKPAEQKIQEVSPKVEKSAQKQTTKESQKISQKVQEKTKESTEQKPKITEQVTQKNILNQ